MKPQNGTRFSHRTQHRLRRRGAVATVLAVASALLAVPLAIATPSAARATGDPPRPFEKHPFFTHPFGLDHPTGSTYVDSLGAVAVAQPRPGGGSSIVLVDPRTDSEIRRMTVGTLAATPTLADNGHRVLAALSGGRFQTWSADATGAAAVTQRRLVGATIDSPVGMTYDPLADRWLVLDGARQRLVSLQVTGAVVQATPGPSLAGLGAGQLAGLALDGTSGRLYVADTSRHLLLAVSRAGRLLATFDLTGIPLTSLRSMAFGATADPTDSPALTSLYATDAGGPATFGRVAEISLAPLGQAAATAPTTSTATLVRKTLLSQMSPPSPDPSGIAYMSDQKRLLVADSEVDEMAIYQNVNLWQIPRSGSPILTTGNTLKYSKEPTGVAVDPVHNRAFFSDDDKQKIFQVTTGPDNTLGTADDPVTKFSTSAFGDTDPEDVAYDSRTGDLYITQGVGSEVWHVSPGPDGRFNGVAPAGDDVVTHFDTTGYGITDLEGITYSPTRDSLFLCDRKYTKLVEVTTDGALRQSIDISAMGMLNPAAVALAPGSVDPSATDLYVVTRGVDNDSHPTENDGTMYELSAPGLEPINQATNEAPTVSAGPDSTVSLPEKALLEGTVTDDGLPDPPGMTTSTWNVVSGPGTVTFTDAGAARTTASFSAEGTYVLRLTATDSKLTVSDDVTVLATPPSPVNDAPAVSAGPDQTVIFPASASLRGSASDDGLPNPPATLTVAWSKVSGPGTVTFKAPAATDTLATFSVDGTYVLRLTASDSELSVSDDVTVVVEPQAPSGNLVDNSGFEVDTKGWNAPAGTTLTRVAAPHTGSWAAQLTNTSTVSARCTLNDSPNWVTVSSMGTYTVAAWVRGDAASAGSTVRLLLREYVGQTGVGSKEALVTLTTDWQQVVLTYVAVAPMSSTLDLNVVRYTTPAGAMCFQADDVSIELS